MDESLFQRKGSIPFLLRNTVICAVSLFFWAALILLGSYFSTLLGITAALLGGIVLTLVFRRFYAKNIKLTLELDRACRTRLLEKYLSGDVPPEGDLTEAETAILEAKQKGIIIGSMDSGTADYVDFYVASDNPLLGKTTAEALVEKMGTKGKIIEIINDAGSMIRMRKEAAHKVFDQYPDIEIAYSLVYSWPDYDADIMDQVSAILTKEGDNISGVFASFDGVGVSAYKAIKEFGLQDKIFICGVDGDPDVYALMKADGENCNYICTMAQDPDTMARTCVRAVVDLLNGKTLDSKVEYIPGIKVTPANVNEIG